MVNIFTSCFPCWGREEKLRRLKCQIESLLKDVSGDHVDGDRPRRSPLEDALLKNLWGFKARKKFLADLDLNGVEPTTFDQEEENIGKEGPNSTSCY